MQRRGSNEYKLSTPWPIVKSHNVVLSDLHYRQAVDIANHFKAENSDFDFMPNKEPVSTGWKTGPTLYFEDHRGVDLVSEQSARLFEYRMLGLAGEGDTYLISRQSDTLFEDYIHSAVGTGPVNIIELDKRETIESSSLSAACLESSAALKHIAESTRKAGGLNIAPYQVTKDVWDLAHKIADISGCPIRVAGPTPALSERANDKTWFHDLAEILLGADAVPVSFTTYCLELTATIISRLAKEHNKLVIKIPSSAGGLGNIVLLSNDVHHLDGIDLRKFLSEKLSMKGWSTGKPLLVGVWDDHVIGSPSVQIWIPDIGQEGPIIEGVFEQLIKGQSGAFVGATRSAREADLQSRLAYDAMRIALVFQHLGYFGRLSLDTVLMELPGGEMKVHWIEANARWGGVSIPMTIGNKIMDDGKPVSVLVLQKLREPGHEHTIGDKLLEIGVAELSLQRDLKKGFVRLLPPSDKLQLLAAFGLEKAELNLLKAN